MTAQPDRVARISLESLGSNIERALALFGGPIDISGDAYGHGAVRVARAALDAGAQDLWVRHDDDARWLRTEGLGETLARGDAPSPQSRDLVYGIADSATPIMTLSGRVLLSKRIARGDGISYGYTFRAPADGHTALVSLGYGDGIHRRAGNVATVSLNGGEYPIVGRVAMNAFVVYLGDDRAEVGDEVVLFGIAPGQPSLTSWAERLSEHPLAVTSLLTDRVSRVYS